MFRPCSDVSYMHPANAITLTLNAILSLATALINVPQAVALVMSRSTQGVNVFTYLIGIGNAFLPMFSHTFNNMEQVIGCKYTSFDVCLMNNFLIQTNAFLALSYAIVVVAWVWAGLREVRARASSAPTPAYFAALFATVVAIIAGAGAIFGTLGPAAVRLGSSCTGWLQVTGNTFGIASSVVSSVQWIPQLISVAKTTNGGSASLLSLALMAAGSIYIAITSAQNSDSWYAWSSYLVGAAFTGICSVIIVYKRLRAGISVFRPPPPSNDQYDSLHDENSQENVEIEVVKPVNE